MPTTLDLPSVLASRLQSAIDQLQDVVGGLKDALELGGEMHPRTEAVLVTSHDRLEGEMSYLLNEVKRLARERRDTGIAPVPAEAATAIDEAIVGEHCPQCWSLDTARVF